MTVMNDNVRAQGQVEDFRSKPRWSANKKTDAVLRLLRGEARDELSRELGVEAHWLAAWRDDFRLPRARQAGAEGLAIGSGRRDRATTATCRT